MHTAARIAFLAVLGMFVFAACDTGFTGGGNEDGGSMQTAAAPVISPATVNHTDSVSITMTTTTPGATIRYTTNGASPSQSSPAYEQGVPVVLSGEGTYTVRAFAQAPGFLDSPVSNRTYTIIASQPVTIATPEFFDTSDDQVMISATYPGTVTLRGEAEESYFRIYYTLDGSDPTYEASDMGSLPVIHGTELVNNLKIDRPLTFKAIAVDIGAMPPVVSDIAQLDIGIKLLPPVVLYDNPNMGPQLTSDTTTSIIDWNKDGLQVWLTDPPAVADGITLHYTLDGNDPTIASPTILPDAWLAPELLDPSDGTFKVVASWDAEGYESSDVVLAPYRRRAAPIAVEFDPPRDELNAPSPSRVVLTSPQAGAALEYRLSASQPWFDIWLPYDPAHPPYIIPNFSTTVAVRATAAGFETYENLNAGAPDPNGLVYLRKNGSVYSVYIYQSGSISDDILLGDFDAGIDGGTAEVRSIAGYHGSLFYSTEEGDAIYRWDPAGPDTALPNLNLQPGEIITYLTSDTVTDQDLFYVTSDGTIARRIWRYAHNAADFELSSLFVAGAYSVATTGLYFEQDSGDYYYLQNDSTIRANTYDDGVTMSFYLDDTRDGNPVAALDLAKDGNGWVYLDGGYLYRLGLASSTDDTLLPNVDHAGQVVGMTGK